MGFFVQNYEKSQENYGHHGKKLKMEVNELYINLMSQLDIHMRLAFLLSFTYC